VSQPVDRVLHLTRVTRFDNEGAGETAPTSAALTAAPRPQPKGLRARYQPFGVTNGIAGTIGMDASDSDGDVEMAQAPPLPVEPTKKAPKKRKHGDVAKETPDQEDVSYTPAKKSKKARVESSKPVKETPVAPPVPQSSAKAAKAPEPELSSPVKKSKSKAKSKTADTAAKETKRPSKITPVLPPAVPNMKSA